MYAVRDFGGRFSSKGELECGDMFFVCSKSRNALKKEMGSDVLKNLEVCVRANYRSALYKYEHDIVEVKFSAEEAKKVEGICKYKQQYNGRGEDPKCVSKRQKS
jgi:hypothetical protein